MYLDCCFIPAHMYLGCCFIPAHMFLYVLVFVLKDRNVISLYEIIKFAWLDLTWWGDRVTQLVECRNRDSMTPKVRTPCQEHKKMCFSVKKILLTYCRCAQPLCVNAHIRIKFADVKDPVVHVSVWWIYRNMKRPSMHFTDRRINVLLYSKFNSRVVSLLLVICTLNSAHWQQASNLSTQPSMLQ